MLAAFHSFWHVDYEYSHFLKTSNIYTKTYNFMQIFLFFYTCIQFLNMTLRRQTGPSLNGWSATFALRSEEIRVLYFFEINKCLSWRSLVTSDMHLIIQARIFQSWELQLPSGYLPNTTMLTMSSLYTSINCRSSNERRRYANKVTLRCNYYYYYWMRAQHAKKHW